MTKITKFDRATIKHGGIPEKALAALQAVAKEYGLTVDYAGGSFDDLTYTLKAKFKVNDPAAEQIKRKAEFVSYCALFGMKPEHFGGTFISKGEAYRVTGLEIGRSKYPVRACRVSDAKVLLFSTDIVPKIAPAAA